jgi:hypothetical protein
MASNELKAFLQSINQRYVQYADQLHIASFTDVTELAAASPEVLEERAHVPIGPAGAIVKAAGAFWISNDSPQSEVKQFCARTFFQTA